MKIIFLDVDGVLNDRFTDETYDGYIFVSEDKLKRLHRLQETTGAEIVLSSTWRLGWLYKDKDPAYFGTEWWLFEALYDKIEEYGMDLLDYTADLGHRGKEISEWLAAHDSVESYVVLDDMDEKELYPHAERLVQTDISEGLTDQKVDEAIDLLRL